MVGEKEKLMVIGKAATPRAFKNITVSELPIVWKSNKKSWMTMDIMSEWLRQFDRKTATQERKILLFLANATSHPKHLQLKNINLVYLPPNTTCVPQPLDQGIIRNFKYYYKSLLMKHILSKMDLTNNSSELAKNINVLDAIYFINIAWKSVTKKTVENCFKKAEFHKNEQEEVVSEDEIPLSELAEILKSQNYSDGVITSDYVNIDYYISTENHLVWDRPDLPDQEEEAIEEIADGPEEEEEEISIKTHVEALQVLQQLTSFARNDYKAFELLKHVQSHFESEHIKLKIAKSVQPKITTFFNVN